MTAPTVVGEIEAMRSRGFGADFSVTSEGTLRCTSCRHVLPPTSAIIESTARFEGASNPDDQAAVFGLRCSGCDVRGILVTAYGPTASAEEADVMLALSDRPPA